MAKTDKLADKKVVKKDAKPGKFKAWLIRMGNFFKATWGELKKVAWPSKKNLKETSFTVIGFIIALSIVIGLLDFGFGQLLNLIVG